MWTQYWSRKAVAAVFKKTRKEPQELQYHRPAKDQGGNVKAGVDDQWKMCKELQFKALAGTGQQRH